VSGRAIYHLVPRQEWLAADPDRAYTPAAFASDGFVHCTEGEQEVADTANRYYATLGDDLLLLRLDRTQLGPLVRYDDPTGIFPHIYGPIARSAILSVAQLRRDQAGRWQPPDAP
jgi:uncharacterized protein (DUF952 family)